MKKRTFKILGSIGILPLLIIITITAFFLFSYLQTWLAVRIAGYISSKTGTEVSIKKADFDIFGNINLYGIIVKDTCNDTLIYSSHISADLEDFSLKKGYVFFSDAFAGSPYFYIHIYNNGKNNLSLFLSKLQSSRETNDSTSNQFKILFGNVTIKNGTFVLKNDETHYTTDSTSINFSDIKLKSIFAQINNLRIKDNINFEIEHLAAIEKSGFHIKHIFTQAFISTHKFSMNNLKVVTNNSYLSLDSLIFYNKTDNVFSGITTTTVWKAGFNQTAFSLDDINYLSPGAFSGSCPLIVNGYVYGKLNNLHLKNMNVLWGDSSSLEISGNISGLPEIDNTLFYLKFPSLKTSKTDLDVLLKGFVSDSTFTLPEILNKTGTIKYKGNLTGFYNDFVVYGTLNSKLGTIKTDIGLKQDTDLYLQGHLSTDHLKLNSLTGVHDTIAGDLTMSGQINGVIKKDGKFKFDLETTNSSITLMGHNYKNIVVDGILDNNSFDGEVTVKDTALAMVFLGQVDFSEKKPIFYFTADVKHADLNTMFGKRNTTNTDSLKFLLKSKISGISPSEINGEIELYQTALYSSGKTYPAKELILTIKNDTGKSKAITINSGIISGKVN
jgi:hypothetical protein